MMRVLIIEDEVSIAGAIQEYFYEGNELQIAEDLPEARNALYTSNWDCILLDIGLPSGSGLELMSEIRNLQPNSIVIILTAKNSESDKITGLESGADDYLTKPFSMAELQTRIKSILRRLSRVQSNTLEYRGLLLKEQSHEIYFNHQLLDMTFTEFEILKLFISNVNKVITKQNLLQTIWNEKMERISSEEILYNHIKNIRKKILDAGSPDLIQTVYGLGYKLK